MRALLFFTALVALSTPSAARDGRVLFGREVFSAIAPATEVLRSTYYPYGEPHRTPAGQSRLYAGKERMAVTADYDYGARQHFAPALLWTVPDALAKETPHISPYVFCNGNSIANVDPDGNSPTIFTAAIGAAIGAAFYSCTELITQLFKDDPTDWNAVGGAAVRGTIVGGATGGTLGLGTAAAIAATTAANVAGGMADRAVQGEEVLSSEEIVTDAAVGAASGVVGAAIGKGVEKALDKASPSVKGQIGEAVTKYKYKAKGYDVVQNPHKVLTGRTTNTGRKEKAHFDFLLENKKTGDIIIRESKFNMSGKTPNQIRAWNKCDYPIDIDRTTSTDIGNWVRNTSLLYPALAPEKR